MSNNPYLDLISSQAASGTAPTANPYLDTLDQQEKDQRGRAAMAVSTQLDQNPDKAAQNTQLARKFKTTPAVVDQWPEEFRQRAITDAAREALDGAPTLAKTLAANPRAAANIHDDIPVTAAVEKTARSLPTRIGDYLFSDPRADDTLFGDVKDVYNITGAGLSKVFVDYPAKAVGSLGLLVDKLFDTNLADYPFALAYGYEKYRDAVFERAATDKSLKGKAKSVVGDTLAVVGEAMATGGEAPAVRFGAPALEAVMGGVQHGIRSMLVPATAASQETAQKVKEAGGTDAEAARAGLAAYLTTTMGGIVPFAKQGSPLLTRIGSGALAGPITGEVSRLTMNAAMPEGMQQEAPGADDLLLQALSGGVFGGMVHGHDAADITSRLTAYARSTYSASAKAGEALQAEGLLRKLSELTVNGKLRERDAEGFKQLLADVSDDANVDGVWIDARKLAEVLDAHGAEGTHLVEVLPRVADQMREALQTEGQVRISLDDYATHVMGGALEEAIIPHLRVDQNGPTIGEAQKFEQTQRENMAGEAAKILDEKATDDAFKASRKQVVDSVKEQLAGTKRFPADVSNLYAEHLGNFYTVLANELKIKPHEAMERYPVKIQGDRGQGAQVMDQIGSRPGAVSVEGYHYSKADRSTLSSSMFGTGLQGSARDEILNHPDKRLSKRLSFYVDKGTGINPEAGVGGRGHRAKLDNLYDANGDPLRLRTGDARAFESKLLDLGYSGYLDRMSGTQSAQAILLGEHNLQPEVLGALGKTSGEVVGPAAPRPSLGRDVVVDALEADKSLPSGAPTLERWHGILEKSNPDALKALTDAGVFNGQAEENLYKSDLIARFKRNTVDPDYGTAGSSLAQGLPDDGGVRGGDGLLAGEGGAHQGAGREADGSLRGLPRDVGGFRASAYPEAQRVARAYMEAAGLPYEPPTEYAKVDVDRARRIAEAFDAMKHDPHDPEVKAAYDQMVREVAAQYQAALDSGLKVEFVVGEDPYAGNPRAMTEDVRQNNHMWVFSTRDGFGSDASFDPKDNPLLAETEFEISGQKALANDLFRAVHDYFGHVKEGVGFRAGGEENAWQAHRAMFSPLAARAMTTETRGQNSWLNYGPHGETNRTAKVEDTHFADQKIGLLPEWVTNEGYLGGRQTLDQGGVDQTQTPEFKAWFGDSKVVDAEGNPLVVYHGTDKNFEAFDPKKIGDNFGVDKAGFFFTSSPVGASAYASPGSEFAATGLGLTPGYEARPGAVVMPAYLAIRNPLTLDAYTDAFYTNPKVEIDDQGISLTDYFDDNRASIVDFVQQGGHDGVVFSHNGKTLAVALKPEQIKSATGNRGTFDANDPSILNQQARGQISFAKDITSEASVISLLKGADLSTFLHESAHFFLQVYADVASRADAPAKIAADMQKLLDWFGVPDIATWKSMTADQQRVHHEAFARGFEAHLIGGEAPSLAQQSMFQRFASWLTQVYKSIKALNVELTPEVTGVMDRMVASENAIKEAETARGLRALFDTKPEGMTDEAWAKYTEENMAATGAAVADLQRKSIRDMQWLSNAKSKAMKGLQREAREKRKAIQEEVTKEVEAMPAFQAKAELDKARADSKEDWRAGRDADPEIIADKYGFNSAEEMLQAIADHGNKADVIEGMTDQRMLERHGELVDPRSIERAAEAAIHNDVRARVLSRELNALAKATGSARLLAKAAQEAAEAAIGAKVISELRPLQYPIAEGKAGRLAMEAFKKGDTATAAIQKRAQLLNNRLAKAAIDAADMIRKGLTYQAKFDRASVRERLDGEFLEQIDRLRSLVDFRQTPPAENKQLRSLMDFGLALQGEGYEPQIPDWLKTMQQSTSYKKLTVEQFRGVIDAMRSLEHIARDRQRVRVAGEMAAVRDIVDNQLVPRLEQRGEKFTKADLLDSPQAKVDGFWRAFTHWMGVKARLVHSDLLGTDYRFNRYDLHDLAGPFRSIILDRFLDANYRKVDLTKAVSERAGKIGEALGKDWQKSLYDVLPNSTLMDPDLSTPDKAVPLKMTRGKLLGIARHIGNESNFEKLVKGWGWKAEDVVAYLQEHMRAADWRATQAHWDSFDPLWKETEAMVRRLGGVPPPKIPAREFTVTVNGERIDMRGGYSPIDYDPIRSKLSVRKGEFSLDPSDKVENMPRYTATTTSNGSLNARQQGYTDRVALDFHGADARIRDTIHDLAYREALLDATKIINDRTFREKFQGAYGREEYQALVDWMRSIRDTNVQDPRTRNFDKAMQYTRQGVVLTGIGYRVSTVLKHGGAAALKSLGYLGNAEGAKFFASRLARMGSGHMAEDIAGAKEKFSEIRARSMQMDRDYSEGTKSMYEAEDWRAKNDRFGHMMVAWSDLLSAVPTAWAAYDLAVAKGVPKSMGGSGVPMGEEAAVRYANSVVRQAHGSALEVARSNFLQSRGAKGFFGALYGFMNNTYGQMADLLDKSTGNGYFRNNPAVAARLMSCLIVPALWTEWLKESKPEEGHSWWSWVGKGLLDETAAMVPFVRDAVGILEYGRNPAVAPVQAFSDALNAGKDLWEEAHGKSTRLIQDLSNAIGEWGHIAGLGELGHILQHMRDVAEGKKDPSVWHAVVGGKEEKK